MFCSPNSKRRAADRAPRECTTGGTRASRPTPAESTGRFREKHSRNNDAGLCCIELRP